MAEEVHYASSASEVTTTSNANWATVAELAFTPETTGLFDVIGYLEVSSSAANIGAQFRLIHLESGAELQARREPQEVSNPPDYWGLPLLKEFSLTGGAQAILRLQIKAANGAPTVRGRNASIVARRRQPDDRADIPATEAVVTNPSTVSAASATAAATGLYLIIGAGLYTDGLGAHLDLSLWRNGAQLPGGPVTCRRKDSNDRLPIIISHVAALSEGDEVSLGIASASLGANRFTDHRLLLWRLDSIAGWSGSNYALLTVDETATASTSFVDGALSLSFTPDPTIAYLIFASWSQGSSSGSVSAYSHLVDGGVEVAHTVVEHSTTNYDCASGVAYRASYPGLSRTLAIGRRGETNGVTVGIESPAVIVAIPLLEEGPIGTVSIIEGVDTSGSSALLRLRVFAMPTDAADRLDATGSLTIGVDAQPVEAADALVSAGGEPSSAASVDAAEAHDSLASAGMLSIEAAAPLPESADLSAVHGSLRVAAFATIFEADEILSGTADLGPVYALGPTPDERILGLFGMDRALFLPPAPSRMLSVPGQDRSLMLAPVPPRRRIVDGETARLVAVPPSLPRRIFA